MNITFKSEEEQLIQEKLKSGKYATDYEVIYELKVGYRGVKKLG